MLDFAGVDAITPLQLKEPAGRVKRCSHQMKDGLVARSRHIFNFKRFGDEHE